MPAWRSGAWAAGAWQGTAWQEAAPVTVPDVVGLTEAAAVAAIEAEGLVADASFQYSSTVAAGFVISQAPAGGSIVSAGSTVSFAVSLGVRPPSPSTTATDPKLIARRRRGPTVAEQMEELRALGFADDEVVLLIAAMAALGIVQ